MTVADTRTADPRAAAPIETRVDRLRTMLVDRAAARCAEAGHRRIALLGDGNNIRRYIRQPWQWRGVTVAAVVSSRHTESIEGVPVFDPSRADGPLTEVAAEAIVVLPDADEPAAFDRAIGLVGDRLPIVRVFEPVAPPSALAPAETQSRLLSSGLDHADAAWIAANVAERHDASVPSLPPERTEMHLRRYWLAARFAAGARVIDAACGTGYGSALLGQAAAAVLGIDIDEHAIDYARRHHGGESVAFECADVVSLPADDASADLVTSFETIEHLTDPGKLVIEFARVLRSGGRLVLSTPNDRGLTDFHEQSLTMADLETLLADSFTIDRRLGQIPGNDPVSAGSPPGIFEIVPDSTAPETLLVVATRR